ncbi:MAG: PAAR domain-containing protein [Pirellulales bacterium]|nr:PAAR domain-containing protein [Pirellulales bacterium]
MPQPAAHALEPRTSPRAVATAPLGANGEPAGRATVLARGMPTLRMGDAAPSPAPALPIVSGSPTVLIGGRPAARIGDQAADGGLVVSGCPSVLIG